MKPQLRTTLVGVPLLPNELTLPYINHKDWNLDFGNIEIYNIPEELEDDVVRFVFNAVEIQNLVKENETFKNRIWW